MGMSMSALAATTLAAAHKHVILTMLVFSLDPKPR